ncbi:MAG: AAA family ATPase [Candidatus Staskawiczbacteria bacterium]|nr:AAA family ATPase [Candidatus Staskawiczbacteria bacterium]
MKKIIGLIGEMGAGKDTFCDFVRANYQNVYFLKFSDALTEVLKMFFDEVKREDQQWLSSALRERFGQDILVKALVKKIEKISDGIIILNGVRRPDDFKALKSIGGKLIYVTADQKLRWERVKTRGEKADDDVPFEKFVEMGKAEAESLITTIGAEADLKIENNSSKEDLYIKIKESIDSI